MATSKKTLESSMARVEEIVKLLDDSTISLEESIKLYTEGVTLSAECKNLIAKAELVIEEKKA